MTQVTVFWFRRDLRLDDNRGLYQALLSGNPVLPLFIFDTSILDKLTVGTDPRLPFIYRQVAELKSRLEQNGSSLMVFHGKPEEAFRYISGKYSIVEVFANGDYEPYATSRDNETGRLLEGMNAGFRIFRDQVIFEKNEVVKDDHSPYTVFTPYSIKWKKRLNQSDLEELPSGSLLGNCLKCSPFPMLASSDMGFSDTGVQYPANEISLNIIRDYEKTRDLPAMAGTTRLGIHLRFGTISIRRLCTVALELSPVFLNELIWREFFMAILWHFPHVADGPFKRN